eukprot:gene18903-biopygen12987
MVNSCCPPPPKQGCLRDVRTGVVMKTATVPRIRCRRRWRWSALRTRIPGTAATWVGTPRSLNRARR